MIRSDLPLVALAELPGGAEPPVLCPSARLAAELRRSHGALQAARGARTWQALQSATPAQWLDHLVSAALLRGDIPAEAAEGGFLVRAQELCLWEQAVAADGEPAAALFDREGLARAALEAANLEQDWRLEVPAALQTAEYAAFMRWRERVGEACRTGRQRTAAESLAWRIGCVGRGIGGLPAQLGLAGFVDAEPWLLRLLAVLEARGVALFRVDFGLATAAVPIAHEFADAEAEARAAAAWAAETLARMPAARLRLAVSDLPARRAQIESALDEALHADAVGAGWAAHERDYAFAGGDALAAVPVVDTALRLLQMFAAPQRVDLADFGLLLRAPGWSADVDEADARARIERALREMLPPQASLERAARMVSRAAVDADAPQLVAHLAALLEARRQAPRRQAASAWGSLFATLLDALGWPGQRPPLAAEAAARSELHERLLGLAALDGVLGRVDAAEALRQLRRLCRERAFVPPRRRPPRVEVCNLGDALAGPVDGLWVMGLVEGSWPPPPRPNPLLPAELQRRAGMAAARADRLTAIAQETQAAWLAGAGCAVLSWPRAEGERPLRPSPLLAGCAMSAAPAPSRAAAPCLPAEAIDDAQGPPLHPGEPVRGGTALLAAQAACPAWAFHRYRLGAEALPVPAAGLDAMARGSLVHAALEAFWRGRRHADLAAMDAAARAAEIVRVVELALTRHDRDAAEPLPPRLRELEARRLAGLVEDWLALEAARADFDVVACEEAHRLVIEGVPIRIVVDRVDRLGDGRFAIIDYKTGRSDGSAGWARERLAEPQLPIYAALAFPDRDVAAVALARVGREAAGFVGVAADEGLLPGVSGLAGQRKRYPEQEFADWAALRRVWGERLRAVAREVRDGVAGVVFASAKDLQYCEVKPLLRLAEAGAPVEEDGE